jgi:voltage-dependent calcium channel
MERKDTYLHTPKSSSSSAIDLHAGSAPPSPSLGPLDTHGSFTRRRASWGQRPIDEVQDPFQLDSFQQPSSPHSAAFSSALPTSRSGPICLPLDNPFTQDDPKFPSARYGSPDRDMHPYSNSQAGPSTAALIEPPGFREFDEEDGHDGHREDDEAHLTENMSHNESEERYYARDPEQSPVSPRSRSRTVLRYSAPTSPLKKTGTAIKNLSHNFRRASLRVVNLASAGLESQIRLPDGPDEGTRGERLALSKGEESEEPLPNLGKTLPLRGRTLGCLGPKNKLRLVLFNFLVYPCVMLFPSCFDWSFTELWEDGLNLLYFCSLLSMLLY